MRAVITLLVIIFLPWSSGYAATDTETKPSQASKLRAGEGMTLVAVQCGVCHSLALVTQNRADRRGWAALIRWMQAKHGLWPLGEFEAPILDYLAEHYAPSPAGRRQPLGMALLPKPREGD